MPWMVPHACWSRCRCICQVLVLLLMHCRCRQVVSDLISGYWRIMWSINIANCCLFMLLNSVDELYAYYYWMLIPPLLFKCCLYVGNMQITRTSCWCELTLSRVVLGSLLYVTGWGSLHCFPFVTYYFELCCWTFGMNFNKLFSMRP